MRYAAALVGILLVVATAASAQSIMTERQGGTGTSTPSHFLFGSNGKIVSVTTIAASYIDSAIARVSQLSDYLTRASYFASTTPEHITGLPNLSITESQISDLGAYITSSALTPYLTLADWYATTTSDLGEGTNLYYTDARARAAISETVNGLTYNNSTGVLDLTAGFSIPRFASTTEWATAYGWGNHAAAGYITSDGQFSTTSADYWDTTKSRWATTSADHWLTTKSTTNIAEGTNLYYTLARWASALAGTTTDALAEGSTRLYYTDARVGAYISGSSTVPHIGGSAAGDILRWTGSAWGTMATSGINYQWGALGGIPAGFADGVDDTGSTLSGGTAGLLTAWTDATTLTATGSPTVGYLTATSGTSTFAGRVHIANGAVTSPGIAFANDTDTGLYLNGTGLGLGAGGAGITWNGAALYPNTTNARTLGIDGTNVWNNLYANYASTTAVTATTFWGALTGNVTGTASGNDVLGQATSTLASHTTTYNHANYDTAYGWGNHASAGYQTAANVYSIVGGTTTLSNLTITASQVSDLTASVNSYIHGSTTIPKTYTANTFTGLQTFGNASTTAISANTICILTDCRSAWPTGGSGISSLNGLTDATQTFATSSDTNIGLTITSAGTAHTFTSSWTGSLAVSRGGTGHTAIASGALLYGSGTAAVATSSNLILRPTTAETIADGYARIYHTAANDMYFETTTDDPAFVFSAGYDIFRIDAENSVVSSGFPFDVNSILTNTFGGPLVAESGTSTFTGIQIGSNGLQVSTLNAASCDLKATTDGTFYCGTDATGVGGSGVVASSTATYVVYKLGSTYYAYNATTTAVTSNADFDVLLQSLVDVLDGGRAGGIIHIKSGDYYANATTSIAGNDSGSYNNGGRVTIQGDGTDSTRIIMYGNADFLDFEDAAIFSVKDLSVYVTGGSNGFVADSNDNDTRAAWLFNFENVHVAATTTHTGRAFDLGNVFRGRFENIEMFGVHHCMRFRAEGTFNPGDLVLSRSFCELDNTANGISYEFTEDSTGFMNQVHFEMVEGIAQSTGATFIKAEDLSFATLYNLNAEQYDVLVDQQVGSGVTYHFNYATHRTGAASLKGCRFATGASGNTCEFRMLNTSANFQVIDDANTWGDNPNTFIGYIGADSGTASASSSGTTVYRDVKGYGTLDTNLAPGGLFGIFQVFGPFVAKVAAIFNGGVTFNGAVQFLSSLAVGTSTNPTMSSTNNLAINTTAASSSLRFYDGTAERSLNLDRDKTFIISSSTIAALGGNPSATTTLILNRPSRPETYLSWMCTTNTGTWSFRLGDGTASTTGSTCDTTGVENLSLSNAAFVRNEREYLEIGPLSASGVVVTLRFQVRTDAD